MRVTRGCQEIRPPVKRALRGCQKHVQSCEEGVKRLSRGWHHWHEGVKRARGVKSCQESASGCQNMSVPKGCQQGVKSLTRECQEDVKRQQTNVMRVSRGSQAGVSRGDKRLPRGCQEGTMFMSRG